MRIYSKISGNNIFGKQIDKFMNEFEFSVKDFLVLKLYSLVYEDFLEKKTKFKIILKLRKIWTNAIFRFKPNAELQNVKSLICKMIDSNTRIISNRDISSKKVFKLCEYTQYKKANK